MNDMKWIPVTDGYPTEDGWYLVTINADYTGNLIVTEADFSKMTNCFYSADEEYSKLSVLAWMPYPEPYNPNN